MSTSEDQFFLDHCKDLAKVADKRGIIMYSDFLTAQQQQEVLRCQKQWNVVIEFEGGYKEAERKIASFCPPFLQAEEKEYPIEMLEIAQKGSQYASRELSHRDCLGSVLGTGLERNKTGDILVQNSHAVIFVHSSMSDYILENLSSVGSTPVTVTPFYGDLEAMVPKGKESVLSVASLRLDAMIAHGFHMGRNEACTWIKSGRVQINHIENNKNDQSLNIGDLITVRGKGRMRLLEEKGNSKSGRKMIRVEVYM